MTLKVNVYADGGSRGNPGVAGSGTAVFDAATGELLREIVYVVGTKATNNVAEYHGLLRGLEAAADLGAAEVYVFMDSKLVVEQMSGRWKIKHPDMQQLALEARKLSQNFERVAYTWIPRGQNEHADRLSNDAMDAAASGHAPGVVGDAVEVSEVGEPASGGPQTATWTGATTEPTRLILLRHGQTPMSAASQYAGRSDVALTELGRQQAEASADVLENYGINVIVSSPLKRCQQTAQAVASRLGLRITTIEDLQECDFGEYEGQTYEEAHSSDPDYHSKWVADPALPAPGGESYLDVDKRVSKVRHQLAADYPGQTVLVVTHVQPIKSLVRQAFDVGKEFYSRVHLTLASISIIDIYGPDEPIPMVVQSVGESAHVVHLGA